MTDEIKHCVNCIFSESLSSKDSNGMVAIGQTVHQCRFMPPTPVLIPNGQGGATVTPMFAPVNETIVCAQHRPRDDAANT